VDAFLAQKAAGMLSKQVHAKVLAVLPTMGGAQLQLEFAEVPRAKLCFCLVRRAPGLNFVYTQADVDALADVLDVVTWMCSLDVDEPAFSKDQEIRDLALVLCVTVLSMGKCAQQAHHIS